MTIAVQHCYRHFYSQNACLLTGILTVLLVSPGAADIDWDSLDFTPIHAMQDVDTDGNYTWSVPAGGYWLRGVVLNDPAEMLDPTADLSIGPAFYMGGQWQIYFQALDPEIHPPELIPAALTDDFGGVAVWMGQNYGNHPFFYGWDFGSNVGYSYTNSEWSDDQPGYDEGNELDRINYPINYPINLVGGQRVSDPLRAGDFIAIYARSGLYHAGKYNCNEHHIKTPDYDFDIYIVQRDLPLPITDITLSDIKNINNEFLFDDEYPTREFGGEYYQGQRVQLKNVRITTESIANWGAYGTLTVTDDEGRYFEVKLGDNDSFDLASAPGTGEYCDIIGIFDQEDYKDEEENTITHYRMWALSPDDFLNADRLPGDANMDNVVDDRDATIMAANWNKLHDAYWKHGDFNGDGQVNHGDAALLAANWLQSVPLDAAAPEPGVLMLIVSGGLMFWILRKR